MARCDAASKRDRRSVGFSYPQPAPPPPSRPPMAQPDPDPVAKSAAVLPAAWAVPDAAEEDPASFDEMVKAGWVASVSCPGNLRGPIADLRIKAVRAPAEYPLTVTPREFFALYNPAHGATKRKAAFAPPTDVVRPVDPAHFNFTKVNPQERVLRLWEDVRGPDGALPVLRFGAVEDDTATDGTAAVQHAVLINANPFLGYQSLFVPEPLALHAQVATPAVLRFGCAVSALSSAADFKLGFNSLGACHPHCCCIVALSLDRARVCLCVCWGDCL